MKINSEESSVTGIIIPVDWDEKGNPVSVAILTDNEQELIVNKRNKQGKELQNHLQQRVNACGTVQARRENRYKITVQSYRILEYGRM